MVQRLQTIPLSIEEIERKFGEAYLKYLGERRKASHAVLDLHDKHLKIEVIRNKNSYSDFKATSTAVLSCVFNTMSVVSVVLPLVQIPTPYMGSLPPFLAVPLLSIAVDNEGLTSLSADIAEKADKVFSFANQATNTVKSYSDMSTTGSRVEISARQEEHNRHLGKREQEAQQLDQEINKALNEIEDRRAQRSQLIARIAG